MQFPKERIAKENEQFLLKWLKENDHKLPLTIYGVNKALGWSFGATRGTLLRLAENYKNNILLMEIVDENTKKFKIKVALKNFGSEKRLFDEASNFSKNSAVKNVSVNDNKKISLNQENIERIISLLKKLQLIDENVGEIARNISDLTLLQKFLDLKFGLSNSEKTELDVVIKELEKLNVT